MQVYQQLPTPGFQKSTSPRTSTSVVKFSCKHKSNSDVEVKSVGASIDLTTIRVSIWTSFKRDSFVIKIVRHNINIVTDKDDPLEVDGMLYNCLLRTWIFDVFSDGFEKTLSSYMLINNIKNSFIAKKEYRYFVVECAPSCIIDIINQYACVMAPKNIYSETINPRSKVFKIQPLYMREMAQ